MPTPDLPIDLVHILVFMMPGFFFVRAFSIKEKSGFEYSMLSMFWGIVLIALFYEIFPIDGFLPLLENPYAGAVSFSILAWVLGHILGDITSRFRP